MSNNTKSVIITGASGFIGRALVKKLWNEPDLDVVPVSRSGTKETVSSVGDYRHTRSGDVLVHLGEEPDRSRVNQEGQSYHRQSTGVVDALLSKGFKKVIYSSSASVYGFAGARPYKEESETVCGETYVQSKVDNEGQVMNANGIVARLSNVIGPRMSTKNVISDIVQQLPGKEPITVQNIYPVCDFIWIDDVVEALRLLILKGTHGIFNIGSGVGTSILELIQMALKIYGDPDRPIRSATAVANHCYNVVDICKMRMMFGWSPAYSVCQSLKKIIHQSDRSNHP